jgi:1-acyl-sn-glycerol-3-phosphate acyltransferase
MRNRQQGFAPVSGIVAASHGSILDAINLAAIQPCVFVAGPVIRRLPLVEFLARLGGTIFLDGPARRSLPLVNFQIQRAVRRRLIVVIFPACGDADPAEMKTFASGLFEPAVELGCTLTAAAIDYRDVREGERLPPGSRNGVSVLKQAMRIATRRSCCSMVSFSDPTLLRGDRKQLALMLFGEMMALKFNFGSKF